MIDCIGCINENKKSLICSDCRRNYKDHFMYKDKIVIRYAVMKGNILIGAYSSLLLAKEAKKDNHRIAKLIEVR